MVTLATLWFRNHATSKRSFMLPVQLKIWHMEPRLQAISFHNKYLVKCILKFHPSNTSIPQICSWYINKLPHQTVFPWRLTSGVDFQQYITVQEQYAIVFPIAFWKFLWREQGCDRGRQTYVLCPPVSPIGENPVKKRT